MFDDRSKTSYDFNKLDKLARTTVITEEKKKIESQNVSDAYKKLLGELDKPKAEAKTEIKQEIIKHTKVQSSIDELPSSAYLKTFENQIAVDEEEEQVIQENEIKSTSELNFDNLIEEANQIQLNNVSNNKEVKKLSKPKKNFSFRIKLVAGVYCIIVALFGGWVIGNTVNISKMNSQLYETTAKTSEINANIFNI